MLKSRYDRAKPINLWATPSLLPNNLGSYDGGEGIQAAFVSFGQGIFVFGDSVTPVQTQLAHGNSTASNPKQRVMQIALFNLRGSTAAIVL